MFSDPLKYWAPEERLQVNEGTETCPGLFAAPVRRMTGTIAAFLTKPSHLELRFSLSRL